VKIVACLRTADGKLSDAPRALRADGFREEALSLEIEDLIAEAERLVDSGSVLTAVDAGYPRRWIERLGQAAPPALWIQGKMPSETLIGIVGSRHIEPPIREFAFSIGEEAVRLGHAVVSGGAAGCDYAGAAGALAAGGAAVEILPHGIDHYSRIDRCGISVCAPDEIFSTASAMERNSLIYAGSEQTVVVHARFKAGGTWIGAVEANRKRLCPLVVRDDGDQASRALIALGGIPIVSPNDLRAAVARIPSQKGLFEIG